MATIADRVTGCHGPRARRRDLRIFTRLRNGDGSWGQDDRRVRVDSRWGAGGWTGRRLGFQLGEGPGFVVDRTTPGTADPHLGGITLPDDCPKARNHFGGVAWAPGRILFEGLKHEAFHRLRDVGA